MYFVIGHKRAMHALRATGSGRQVQHIALPQQCLGAHLIKNGTRIDFRRHLKRHARRDIGFNQAGDHIHRGPLRGEYQMDARRTRLLRDARNQFFDFFADHHHKISELVNHHHDQRHFMQRLRLFHAGGQRVGNRHPGFVGIAYFLIKAREIAHAQCRHHFVAALHLTYAPVKRVGCLAHIGHHRRQQMRNAFINRQFQHLRIDQYQPHLCRRCFVEQRQYHGVDRYRLARSGSARHQQMRHTRQIDDHRVPGDIFAHGQR